MNELQWFGLFLVVFGLVGAFLISWHFERREAEVDQLYQKRNKALNERVLKQLFAQDCFDFNLFNLNDLRKSPKTATIEQVRKSTMLEF